MIFLVPCGKPWARCARFFEVECRWHVLIAHQKTERRNLKKEIKKATVKGYEWRSNTKNIREENRPIVKNYPAIEQDFFCNWKWGLGKFPQGVAVDFAFRVQRVKLFGIQKKDPLGDFCWKPLVGFHYM